MIIDQPLHLCSVFPFQILSHVQAVKLMLVKRWMFKVMSPPAAFLSVWKKQRESLQVCSMQHGPRHIKQTQPVHHQFSEIRRPNLSFKWNQKSAVKAGGIGEVSVTRQKSNIAMKRGQMFLPRLPLLHRSTPATNLTSTNSKTCLTRRRASSSVCNVCNIC